MPVNLAGFIAQTIAEQFDPATQAGLEAWRHDQVEIANQTIRFLRQQVQMQGVTTTQATSLGQILLRQQPAQLDLGQVTAVLGQYVDTYRTFDWLRQADAQFAQGEEIQALAQHHDRLHGTNPHPPTRGGAILRCRSTLTP